MKINKSSEVFFLSLVKENKLIVNSDGTILNNKTKNVLGKNHKSKYNSISWKDDKTSRHILVHRLVFLVHGGILTEEFPLVNHKDGNKKNNHIDNLEASNNSLNVKHAFDNGLKTTSSNNRKILSINNQGEKSNFAVLNDKLALVIFNEYKTNLYTHRELGKKYNVAHTTIGDIIRGRTYNHITNLPKIKR